MVSAEQPQMSLMTSGITCVFLRQVSWFTLAFLLGKYGCGYEYGIFDWSSRRAAFCFDKVAEKPINPLFSLQYY